MAVVRRIGTVDAIAIALPRPELGHIPVPHLIGAFGERQAQPLIGTLRGVEEAEVHPGRMGGEQGKIHPRAIPGGAQGIGMSRPDVHRSALMTAGSRVRRTRGASGAGLTACLACLCRTVSASRPCDRGAAMEAPLRSLACEASAYMASVRLPTMMCGDHRQSRGIAA